MKVTRVGLNAKQLRWFGTLSVKVMVPLKLLTLVRVKLEVADWPTFAAAGDEALTWKSPT